MFSLTPGLMAQVGTCRSSDWTWICALGTTLVRVGVCGSEMYLYWCVDVHHVSNFADTIGYFLEFSLSSPRDDHFCTGSSQTKRTATGNRRYK